MRLSIPLLVIAFLAAPLAQAADAVETLPSGVTVQKLNKTGGAQPKASDQVKVHYRGTLENGTEFDSSYKRGEPAKFPLSRVIPCWTQGVQKLHVGEKARAGLPGQHRIRRGRHPRRHTAQQHAQLRGRADRHRVNRRRRAAVLHRCLPPDAICRLSPA